MSSLQFVPPLHLSLSLYLSVSSSFCTSLSMFSAHSANSKRSLLVMSSLQFIPPLHLSLYLSISSRICTNFSMFSAHSVNNVPCSSCTLYINNMLVVYPRSLQTLLVMTHLHPPCVLCSPCPLCINLYSLGHVPSLSCVLCSSCPLCIDLCSVGRVPSTSKFSLLTVLSLHLPLSTTCTHCVPSS